MSQSTAPKLDPPSQGNGSEGSDDEKPTGFSKTIKDFVNQVKDNLPNLSMPKPEPVLDNFSMDGVVRFIQEGKAKKIIVMTGAGISTSAGIPDFRSPGTGLYDNLKEYNLPDPQAIFEIGYFRKYPEPFFKLAKSLIPTNLKPTPCHYFTRLLHEKGLLLRTYTQNIDGLEHLAGIPSDKIIEAHGTFHTGHCTMCNEEYTLDWMQKKTEETLVPRCEKCEAVVKPDVVFFGESLPMRFHIMIPQDFGDCDLLLIMGTSLVVQPFASLVERVGKRVPRMLINMEKAGQGDMLMRLLGYGCLQYDDDDNYRDVYWSGTCDDGCKLMAEKLGWGDELKDTIKRHWEYLDLQRAKSKEKSEADKPKSVAAGGGGKL